MTAEMSLQDRDACLHETLNEDIFRQVSWTMVNAASKVHRKICKEHFRSTTAMQSDETDRLLTSRQPY